MTTRKIMAAVAACLIAATVGVVSTASPAVAAPVPVSVFVDAVIEIDNPEGLFSECYGDYKITVTIDGVSSTSREFESTAGLGGGCILNPRQRLATPFELTQTIESTDDIIITIKVVDVDGFGNPDDTMDVSPEAGSKTLRLALTDPLAGDVQPVDAAGNPLGPVQPGGRLASFEGDGDDDRAGVNLFVGADSDGDGLFDSWETGGLDIDGGGVDVDLPALGADPNRADIFVEVDCMISDGDGDGLLTNPVDHTQCPSVVPFTQVVQSFANAPVANPDGTTGVQLHLDTGTFFGPGVTPVVGVGGVTGQIGNLGNAVSQIPEVARVNWTGSSSAGDFRAIKGANFDPQRRLVFRYGLIANQVTARSANNDCTSGWARDITTNDFIVSLGGRRDLNGDGTADTPCWAPGPPNGIDDDGDGAIDEDGSNAGIDDDGDFLIDEDPIDGVDNDGDGAIDEDGFVGDDDGDCPGDTDGDGLTCDFGDVGVDEDSGFSLGTNATMAGTFMHELGHTLSFRHGGDNNQNFKPNYLSVMNYGFQGCTVPSSPPGAMFPIPGGCDFSRLAVALDERPSPGLDECFGVGPTLGFGPMNWDGTVDGMNNNTFTGATCVPASGNVAVDINTDDNLSALTGFDDWRAISFSFRGSSSFGRDGGSGPIDADPDDLDIGNEWLPGLANDLEVSVSGPAQVLPGSEIEIGTTIANTGGGPGTGVSARVIDPNGTTDDFSNITVPSGASTQISTTHAIPPSAANGDTFIVSGLATGTDLAGRPELDTSNNRDTHVVAVVAPILEGTKTGPSTTAAGDELAFELSVTNVGGAGAEDTFVNDTMPADTVLTPGSIDPPATSVVSNPDGTTTIVWRIGSLDPGATATVGYLARTSLLNATGETLTNKATVEFTDAIGNGYEPLELSLAVAVDSGPASTEPLFLGQWRQRPAELTAERLARVHATDGRFDGADGSVPDGTLSPAEVDAVLRGGLNQPKGLEAQLLTAYLSMAAGHFHASTPISSRIADAVGAASVRDLVLEAQDVLLLPVDRDSRFRYGLLTRGLDELNKNRSPVYP